VHTLTVRRRVTAPGRRLWQETDSGEVVNAR